YEWIDEWWLSGTGYDPKVQDTASRSSGPFPDGWGHSEWFGIVSQGDGTKSPFMRQLRESYYVYKKIWNEKTDNYSADKNENKDKDKNKDKESLKDLNGDGLLQPENKIIKRQKNDLIDIAEETKRDEDESRLFSKKVKVLIFPLLGMQVLLVFKLLKKEKEG
ncbi:hypothetical protein KAU39_02840, partial [bacterium]|nr:hypothetical protein [bacterium]